MPSHAVAERFAAPGAGPARDTALPKDAATRPRFARTLVAWSMAIFVLLSVDHQGYLAFLGLGSLFEPFLVVVVVISLLAVAWQRPAERAQFAATGIIALNITVPINRIESITQVSLLSFLVAGAVLTVIGVSAIRASHRQVVLIVFVGAITVSTALAGSTSGILKLLMPMVPALGTYLLAGRMGHDGRRNVAMVIVAMAATQAVLVVLQPFVPQLDLWSSTAGDFTTANVENPVFPGLLRAAGTLGYALPLAFLFMVALALVLRVVQPPFWIRWALLILFVVGVLLAGSRTGLILLGVLWLFYPPRKLTMARLSWAGLVAAVVVLVGDLTGQLNFGFVEDVSATGSVTHRAAAVEAFGQLLSRQSLLHVTIGNGFGGIQSLFEAGLLQTDGLNVVDNQFVALLGQGGLIGLAAFVVLTVRPLVARDWHWRGATLVVLVNCMTFDWLSWPNVAVLAFFVLGSAHAENGDRQQARRAAPSSAGTVTPFRRRRIARADAYGTLIPAEAPRTGVVLDDEVVDSRVTNRSC